MDTIFDAALEGDIPARTTIVLKIMRFISTHPGMGPTAEMIYAELQPYGCTPEQFEILMFDFLEEGKIERRWNFYIIGRRDPDEKDEPDTENNEDEC
jgi:hypothetical protein